MDYEQLLLENAQLTEKYNKLFVLWRQAQRIIDTQNYIDWYIENYGHRPSSRLIEKYREANYE